jgi:hypothetical protein
MPRLFSLVEAESLLPEIDRAIREAAERKPRFQAAEAELQTYIRRINMLGGCVVNVPRIAELHSRREVAVSELKEAVQRIQQHGVEVKDLDAGLVDFPTRYRGRTVYLCWKLGEDRIGFWHSTDEGFAGRHPIDDEFRAHHQGDRPV